MQELFKGILEQLHLKNLQPTSVFYKKLTHSFLSYLTCQTQMNFKI